MNRTFYTKLLPVAATVVVALSCGRATTLGFDDSDNSVQGYDIHPSAISVAYLRSLAVGESTIIDKPYSILGRVTATDAYGEYYKSICIEDSTGGIVLLIDGFTLYRRYALYDQVRVDCHGLALARYGSTIQLGMPPAGEYAADYIPEYDIGRYVTVYKFADDSFEPVESSVTELRPEYTGRTVRIGGLHCPSAGEGVCWCDADPLTGGRIDTDRMVSDSSGAELTVCMRGGCRYAGEEIPAGEFSLCGIVEYRGGTYALRITNHGITEYD